MGGRVGLAALIGLAAAHVSFAQEKGPPTRGPKFVVGSQVEDFVLRDLAGQTVRLSDLQKRTPSGVVSLTFWCSYCSSCRNMEDRLEQLVMDHQDEASVIGICSNAGETAQTVSKFLDKYKLRVPMLMDKEFQVASLFGASKTTTTVVIDAQRVVRYRGRFGTVGEPLAQEAVRALLAGRSVPTPETKEAG